MAFVRDAAADAYLANIRDNVVKIHICSSEPATFAAVAGVTLGNKASPTIGAPADATPDGRKISVSAITDGAVTDTGIATHWAAVDEAGEELIATGALSASQSVTDGNTFSLAAFDMARVPDAVDA